MKFYSKQPIEAEQFDGSLEMMDKYDIEPTTLCMAHKHSYTRIYENDWIITGVNGEHWKIANNVFQQQYTELPVIPIFVDKYIKEMKSEGKGLVDALGRVLEHWLVEDDIDEYIGNNSETFARAWLDGYQVEEEK